MLEMEQKLINMDDQMDDFMKNAKAEIEKAALEVGMSMSMSMSMSEANTSKTPFTAGGRLSMGKQSMRRATMTP